MAKKFETEDDYDNEAIRLAKKSERNKKEDPSIAMQVLKGCYELIKLPFKGTAYGLRILTHAILKNGKIVDDRNDDPNKLP